MTGAAVGTKASAGILTPHMKEMNRLLGGKPVCGDCREDRLKSLEEFRRKNIRWSVF